MEAVVRALAEPHRREILRLVADRELPAGQIAANFAVTGPAVSQHLKVLKEAGLVTERRDGTRRLYRARPEGLTELKAFLDGPYLAAAPERAGVWQFPGGKELYAYLARRSTAYRHIAPLVASAVVLPNTNLNDTRRALTRALSERLNA